MTTYEDLIIQEWNAILQATPEQLDERLDAMKMLLLVNKKAQYEFVQKVNQLKDKHFSALEKKVQPVRDDTVVDDYIKDLLIEKYTYAYYKKYFNELIESLGGLLDTFHLW